MPPASGLAIHRNRQLVSVNLSATLITQVESSLIDADDTSSTASCPTKHLAERDICIHIFLTDEIQVHESECSVISRVAALVSFFG